MRTITAQCPHGASITADDNRTTQGTASYLAYMLSNICYQCSYSLPRDLNTPEPPVAAQIPLDPESPA